MTTDKADEDEVNDEQNEEVEATKKPGLALTSKKLFFDFNKTIDVYCYPLEKIKEVWTDDFEKVSLVGVEQVTDMFFITIKEKGLQTGALTTLDLVGCCHITDYAVRLVAEICPSLTDVILTGCKRLTERSLGTLLNHAKVKDITMVGCGIGVVPEITDSDKKVRLGGCPVVSPCLKDLEDNVYDSSHFKVKSTFQPFQTMKVVLLRDKHTDCNLLPGLIKGELDLKQTTREFNVNSNKLTIDKKTTPVHYVECSASYLDLVATDNALYILPYDPSQPDIKMEILIMILHITAKVPHAVFLLGGVNLKGTGTAFATKDVRKMLEEGIEAAQKTLNRCEFMTDSSKLDQQVAFRHQISAGSRHQMSGLMASNTLLTNVFFCEKMFSSKMKKAESGDVTRVLTEALQRVRETHAMYHTISADLLGLMTSVHRQPGISTEADFVSTLKKDTEVFGSRPAIYRKILELMHKFGYLLHIPGNHGDEGLVITDLTWFSDIIHKLNSVKEPAKDVSEDILMVKPETPVLDWARVGEILEQDVKLKKMQLFKRFLEEAGILLQDPNTRHLVMMSDVDKDPPVPKEHYIDDRPKVKKCEKTVKVPCGLPLALYSALLQQASMLHPPSSLCNQALIVQNSPVVIAVSIARSGSEILLHAETAFPTQIAMGKSSDLKAVITLWEKTASKLLDNALGAYQLVIEYCLDRWNLPYVVKKLPTSDSNQLYNTMSFEAVSIDHEIVQETEENVALCGNCGLSPDLISKLWFQYKSVHPTFSSSLIQQCNHKVGVSGSLQVQRGCLVQLDLDTQLWMTRPLSSCCYNTWTVTPLHSPCQFSVALRNIDPDAGRQNLVSLHAADNYEVGKWFKKELTEKESEENAELSEEKRRKKEQEQWDCTKTRVGDTRPTEGDTVTVSARLCLKDEELPEDVLKEELVVEYTIEVGDVVCRAYSPQSEEWYPIVTSHSSEVCDFLVDNSFGVVEVRRTFRLSADTDIENLSAGPPRKLARTMYLEFQKDVREHTYELCSLKLRSDSTLAMNITNTSSRVKIELSDPRLRPYGYASYVQNNITPNIKYMLGGGKIEIDAEIYGRMTAQTKRFPIPHKFLNKSQINGCPPFYVDKTILDKMESSWGKKTASKENTLCSMNIYSCHNLHMSVMKKYSESPLTAQIARELPAVWLPRKMDRHSMLYPTLKDMWLADKENLHLICGHFGWKTHLNDVGGYELPGKLTSTIGKLSSLLLCKEASLVHLASYIKSKNYVPDHVQVLISDVKEWDHKVLESKMNRMFELYLNLGGQGMAFEPLREKLNALSSLNSVKSYSKSVSSLLKTHEPFIPLYEPEGFIQCTKHRGAEVIDMDSIRKDSFAENSHLLTQLKISDNNMKDLPEQFFEMFPGLEELYLDNNALDHLPLGLLALKGLRALVVSGNQLTSLPEDFSACKDTLQVLDLSNNPFVNLPDIVYECTRLEELQANHIILTELKQEIGNLQALYILKLAGNALKSLPKSFKKLVNLSELDLSGVRQFEFSKSSSSQERGGVLSRIGLTSLISKYPIFSTMQSEIEQLFDSCDTAGEGMLSAQTLEGKFNPGLYEMFPRFQQQPSESDGQEPAPGCCPPEIFSLSSLVVLDLSHQGIPTITDSFTKCTSLQELILSNNPVLENIDAGLCNLTHLKAIALKNCPNLKTPPNEVVNRGFRAIFGYLKRLNQGSVECRRTKLMMVGLGGAGKTSLVRALKKTKKTEKTSSSQTNTSRMRTKQTEGITDGIDITDWTSGGVTFSIWDFAGQTVYYNTHQFFMSNRAVYLLLWNIRLGYEHAGLDFWLSSIACHAPKAPILVIGTHCDQVEKSWLPDEEFMARYPQIVGFHIVSCQPNSTKGIEKLASQIVSVALKEKYMGEKIPQAWLNLETRMLSEKNDKDTLLWNFVVDVAQDLGIVHSSELREAVQFFHDLGSVQHFQNAFLKSRVVINPQWIVDAMACVVSVHDTPIKDGVLNHKDIDKIWKKFDKGFYSWLLRLTEELDLTFPLKDQEANVVPCLLPETEAKFTWPDLESQPGSKETKMVYRFDYLPAGLFNRAQVRLYQFSDSSTIWKKGSLLKKNSHLAVLKQRKNTVHLRVQGPRPENITFMVHEVFEGLMIESFHGVTYEYYVPCTDCIKVIPKDPCLFPASKIRKATEYKAPFLQCHERFHTLSLHELHAVMPPDNSTDYNIHLERSLRDLDDLKDDLGYDVFMIYNKGDIPRDDTKTVAPQKIKEDLEANGFNVWFPSDPSQIDIQNIIVILKEAKLVIICISDHFVGDPESCRLFYYIKQNLKKQVQLVVVGESMKWKDSDVGMMCATEVYVNMTDISRYSPKSKELVTSVREGILKKAGTSLGADPPECFISYSWSNSADAVKKGTKCTDTSVGFWDPRQFKKHLEDKGIRCWLDVEKAGKNSLYEDIAQGLRHAKVMVACLSDEYCASNNCIMEFRFALITLKIPIVVAVVGRSLDWIATEVGMLSMGLPKVCLQYETEEGLKPFLEAVEKQLPQVDLTKVPIQNQTPATNNKQLAFQELLEVAQRKFLRQVVLYADSMETSHYPRLLVMDYLRQDEKIHNKEVKTLENEQDNSKHDKTDEEKVQTVESETDNSQKQNPVDEKVQVVENERDNTKHDKTDQEKVKMVESKTDKSQTENPMVEKAENKTDDQIDETSDDEKVEFHESEKDNETIKLPANVKDDAPDDDSEPDEDDFPTSRPTSARTRPKSSMSRSHRLLKRKTSTLTFATEALETLHTDNCVRFMCEHEEGWHVTDFCLPLVVDAVEWDDFLDGVAPYMARLYAILKHTSVSLPVLGTDKGTALCKKLSDKCSKEPEFKNEYVNWRKMVMDTDLDKSKGLLARCYMPSGKILWLCEEHQKQERVTILPDDVEEITMAADKDEPEHSESSEDSPQQAPAHARPSKLTRLKLRPDSDGAQIPYRPIPQERKERKVAPPPAPAPAPVKAPASKACVLM